MFVESTTVAPKGLDETINGKPDSDEGEALEVIVADDETSEEVMALVEEALDEKEEFASNIAEALDKDVLNAISAEVMEAYNEDVLSRAEWVKMYRDGIKMLGIGIEERTTPWEGACGVFHPMMAEAAVNFQAEAVTETFSAQGVCKTTIVGKVTAEKEDAARRVQEDMNWRLTTQMREFRPEHERTMWNLVLAGSAFKKVYFDPSLGRQTSVFVSALDIVVPYGASDLLSAPRVAHRMKKSRNDVRKLQVAGFYRDIKLSDAIVKDDDHEEEDKISGYSSGNDDRVSLIEMCIELNIPGYEDKDEDGEETGIRLPYVVTIEQATGEVLSIYRNWRMDDEQRLPRQHFVHYVYIPGFGFYGLGLVQLAGGLASGATSLLRQLVDAGTLANLPAGFKTKGVRVQRDGDPIEPGEFRDVDVGSGVLKDNILPLPFKEPSATLYQLFSTIVEEGRRMASAADVNAADMNQNAAVGTTLAILERSLRVITAVQARLHASLKDELQLLKNIVRDSLPEEYDYDVDDAEGRSVKQSDYDMAEIIPVSDPNASSLSQRIVQWQTAVQMARDEPQIFDKVELYREGLRIIGMKNIEKMVPNVEDMKPRDAVTENMSIMVGRPVKAFSHQDHEAHISIHMSLTQDPKMAQFMGQNPNASVIYAALQSHIAEHAAFSYKEQVEAELGVELPSADTELSPEVERRISQVVAQAAKQATTKNQQQVAQQQAQQAAQDPVVQNQAKQLAIDEAKVLLSSEELKLKAKMAEDNKMLSLAKLKLGAADIVTKAETARDVAGAKIAADLARDLSKGGNG